MYQQCTATFALVHTQVTSSTPIHINYVEKLHNYATYVANSVLDKYKQLQLRKNIASRVNVYRVRNYLSPTLT